MTRDRVTSPRSDEVLQAAGRGDQDVRPAGGARLLLEAGAAVDGRDGERAGVGQRADLLDDLEGELARGGQDERGLLGTVGLHAVDQGGAEGQGLARAGGGLHEDVAAREHVGDREGLDGERRRGAARGEGVDDDARDAEVGEGRGRTWGAPCGERVRGIGAATAMREIRRTRIAWRLRTENLTGASASVAITVAASGAADPGRGGARPRPRPRPAGSGRGQRGGEGRQGGGVAQRGPVAEEHHPRLERGQAPDGPAVRGGVEREALRRLVQARPAGERVTAEEGVPGQQHPVLLAPVREVAGGVPGRLEHAEAGHLVALAQLAGDGHRRAGPVPQLPARHRVDRREWADRARADRLGLPGRRPQRQAERAAHGRARALVVGVGMGEGVGPDRDAAELAQDPAGGVARRGVHEHVLDEVDVEGVARAAREQPDAGGDLLQRARPARRPGPGPGPPPGSRSLGMRCRIHTPAYSTGPAADVNAVAYPRAMATSAGPDARRRLGRADWERAALAAIARGGLAAVAVEPLARDLGVTKGSFYAHFATRDELLAATLARWEAEHDAGGLAALAPGEDPAARLRGLVEAAVAFTEGIGPSPHVALLGELHDPRVRAALARVNASRTAYLAELFRALGLPPARARDRAQVTYAAFLGLLQLRREGGERRTARARGALARELVAVLLPAA